MSNENINNNDNAEKAAEGAEQNETFASLLEKAGVRERLHPGQKVKTKVVSVSEDLVYVDLGGKTEGAIDISEFTDEKGVVNIHEGDELDAFFVTSQEGQVRLTTLIRGYSASSLNSIRDAFEGGIPVNGDVKKEIKGGFEVSVAGVRCFCPLSHIDLKGVRRNEEYPGNTFQFQVLEFTEDGRKIILSRKTLLKKEKDEKIAKLKQTLTADAEVPCKVKSLQKFGIFADLGGIDGLIPLSELSWDRELSPEDVVSLGQDITVKVISADWESSRITLSLKALQPDPWATAPEKYKVDSKISGTIVRLSPFGAFIKLEPGVEGLIHISNLGAGRRINHPREVVETGQLVEAYVLAVDAKARKISLSMQPKAEPKKIVLPNVGDTLECKVEKIMPFGIFVKMSSGVPGLIPSAESGTPPGTDLKKMFPAGMELQAVVTDVDRENNKVRLSRKSILDKKVQDEFEQYRAFADTSKKSWSIGDILKAKQAE